MNGKKRESVTLKKGVLLTIILCVCLLVAASVILTARLSRTEGVNETAPEIAILFTNDVHCNYDGDMSYAALALVKESLIASGKAVILVDSGDAVQGGIIGAMTEGEALIDIMNAVGYDVSAIGNHEFDYGIQKLMEYAELAEFDYVSCNFLNADNETVFAPYAIVERDGVKVAFLGISTPETISSSIPSYFRNENGEYIYSFCSDESGNLLAEKVTAAAAEARAEGAEYVIALSHLGDSPENSPFTSLEIIAKVSGVDAFLDGHSHSVIEPVKVKDVSGKEVLLVQNGTELEKIGLLTISKSGELSVSQLDNSQVAAVIDEKEEDLSDITGRAVGTSPVDFYIYDPEEPEQRLVRKTETNAGDMCADALRDLFGADIGIMNAGGIRANIEKGEVTYGDLIAVAPFTCKGVLIKATGQQILDALETGLASYPSEYGGFLHVSGLSFDADVSVEAPVKRDGNDFVTEIGAVRRVSNVCVGGLPIDPEKEYTVAAPDYVALENGDGITAFNGAELLNWSGLFIYEILISYFEKAAGEASFAEMYADPYGDGRISFIGD